MLRELNSDYSYEQNTKRCRDITKFRLLMLRAATIDANLLGVRMHSMIREANIDANLYLVCVLTFAGCGTKEGWEEWLSDSYWILLLCSSKTCNEHTSEACCFLIFRSFSFYTKKCDWCSCSRAQLQSLIALCKFSEQLSAQRKRPDLCQDAYALLRESR